MMICSLTAPGSGRTTGAGKIVVSQRRLFQSAFHLRLQSLPCPVAVTSTRGWAELSRERSRLIGVGRTDWCRPLPPPNHWYLHNSQFFVTCSVARDWAAFNGEGSLVNFSVTMDRPQCEGPPHNEGSGEISTRAEGVVAHGVILLLHVDLENRIPRGLTLT